MDAVRGMRVLDLYAGSGALALEAVSRGAASAVLVEQSAQAAAVCRANASALLKASAHGDTDARPRIGVRQATVRAFLREPRPDAPAAAFDLAFLDPPYDVTEDELHAVLDALLPVLDPDAVVVVERSARSPEPTWPTGLDPLRSRSYGETAVWFAQPARPPQPAAPSQPE